MCKMRQAVESGGLHLGACQLMAMPPLAPRRVEHDLRTADCGQNLRAGRMLVWQCQRQRRDGRCSTSSITTTTRTTRTCRRRGCGGCCRPRLTPVHGVQPRTLQRTVTKRSFATMKNAANIKVVETVEVVETDEAASCAHSSKMVIGVPLSKLQLRRRRRPRVPRSLAWRAPGSAMHARTSEPRGRRMSRSQQDSRLPPPPSPPPPRITLLRPRCHPRATD